MSSSILLLKLKSQPIFLISEPKTKGSVKDIVDALPMSLFLGLLTFFTILRVPTARDVFHEVATLLSEALEHPA